MRSRAIEAVRILNDLVLDAVVGTRTLDIFKQFGKSTPLSEEMRVGVARMCYFHLILLLVKWVEFYDKYRSIIPEDCKNDCLLLTKRIRNRRVRAFRNKYVGHVWSNEDRRALTSEEIKTFMTEVSGGNIDDFLEWINNRTNNVYPSSVVSVISHVRDRLRAEYNIDQEPFIS